MRLKLALVLLVTAVFLAVVLWDLDLAAAWAALSETRWTYLAPMALLYLTGHAIRSYRLGLLIGGGVRYWRLFSITAVGFLAINVVPLRLGEMVRPYLLWEREGVPFGRGMAAILLERLLDMAMLLVLLLGIGWFIDLPPGGLVVQGVDIVKAGQRFAGAVVGAGTLVGAALVLVGEPAIRLLERLPAGPRVAGFARKFREGFQELARRPLQALWLLVLTGGLWAATIGGVIVVMAAFPGVPATVAAGWTTWGVVMAGMAVLPTPGFFGGYELFCAAALWLFGVDADLGRTFAVVLHLGQFFFTIVLGGSFLLAEGLSLRSLVAESRTSAGAEPPST